MEDGRRQMMAVNKEGGGIVWKGCVQVTGNAIEKQIVRMFSNCFELPSFALIDSIGNSLRK